MSEIAEVLAKQVLPGDIKKLNNESNNAATGGGARDFRYPKKYREALERFFVADRGKTRVADITVVDCTGKRSIAKDVPFFPVPTESRGSEVRIGQLSSVEGLRKIPALSDQELLFFVLVRYTDGNIEACYLTESSIRDPNSNKKIADEMVAAIEATPSGKAAIFDIEL